MAIWTDAPAAADRQAELTAIMEHVK